MRSLSMQKALAQKRVDMMVRHVAEKTELCLRVFSKFILNGGYGILDYEFNCFSSSEMSIERRVCDSKSFKSKLTKELVFIVLRV